MPTIAEPWVLCIPINYRLKEPRFKPIKDETNQIAVTHPS